MRVYLFFQLKLVFFLVILSWNNLPAKSFKTPQDTLKTKKSEFYPLDSNEAAAAIGEELSLEDIQAISKQGSYSRKLEIPMLFKKYDGVQNQKSVQKKLGNQTYPSQPLRKMNAQVDHEGSKYHINQRKIAKERQNRLRKYRQRVFWSLFEKFKLLDLDWITVGIVVLLPALLIALLYFLLGGTALSFVEMFLLALGFGFALFSYIFLLTEKTPDKASYDFFVKFGIFTWPGILAIIAGFVGLFGGTGSFFAYLLVGLAIGLLTFLLSILVKKSLLNGFNG